MRAIITATTTFTRRMFWNTNAVDSSPRYDSQDVTMEVVGLAVMLTPISIIRDLAEF
jgi:hypothetical protein